ncbi:NTF2-like protein [Clathrospora elynae]|uniref:NTF2-like protein n=1 Tax=Clathrospora elynae TaxID=706981 RepID=A0A6A5S9N3_9PLEO|nr:NTF2-like protein [Clathrospora elynae]
MSDTEQITSLLHRYGTVLASHSIPDLLSIYTKDGVLMAPGFQPAVGTEALTSSYERIFSTIKLEIRFDIDEIEVMNEEWAFARTTAAGTKHWLKKGTQESHHNQEIFILRKLEGEWKIARYCFSSMKPIV